MSIIYNDLIKWGFATLFISMLFYWSSIAFPKVKKLIEIARINILISNCILFINISARWVDIQHFPLSNLYESLLFLTWGMTFISILLEYKTRSSIIGALITPLAMFTIAFATLGLPNSMQKATALVPALKSNWLVMHVSVMMISYAILMVGTLLSILYLALSIYQEVDISKKQNKVLKSLPLSASYAENKVQLLENIDNLSYRTIALGFPLLTLGIISGAVWANEAWGSYWSWDPKETWALITWLVFASYLHVRINRNWLSKDASIVASIGFIVVWICYLGVNFLGQGLHSYGWLQ
uniref:cytochrome c biogenesis protein n=1 Tax=Goniotrichopsis reniformis TaxID=468933 RepID=UPI001FCDB550|nr:cytochrome c biogenesis protein [Goniotrichopsis reniformis]UNJ14874.1 cytochrome c biogenesis protein [Goniotrichopsis reniformis]